MFDQARVLEIALKISNVYVLFYQISQPESAVIGGVLVV